ncbi:hypothetical protein DH2020_022687 [Rehmannia glutinosa]|uniref:Homeobox-leucine zipper protein n=1 Tax=Rehmannia glutinosa TaxID=99300 RepID=A0ABR0W8C0_REHGL
MSDGDESTRNGESDVNSDSDYNINVTSVDRSSQPKRKRSYHRHTPLQIQELEAVFKECPHPDERQRKELSRELGMEPLQVKFWFQNKRTQMKTQHEHTENTQLRMENEKLRAENMRFREVLSNASCLNCGGPTPIRESLSFHEQQLKIENARLRDEIDLISAMTSKQGKPLTSSTNIPSSSTAYLPGNFNGTYQAGDLGSSVKFAQQNELGSKPMVIELATAAMEELMRIAQLGEPLWVPSMDRNTASLNEDEYLRSFSRVFGPKPCGFKSEASRETVVVAMSAANVIEILMDVELWSNVFSGVVSRANNLQVISSGVGGSFNEAIQVVNAEFQVASPLVPTRESYFVRYCRQDVDGTWAVVDVSLDQMHSTPLHICRRRPSGCIVRDMPNGYSKVTWVEHVEVEEGGAQSIYKPLITAGLAFGAKRCVAILDGYCERVERAIATDVPTSDLNYLDQEGRKSMLKLAERMVTRYCSGVNASTGNTWTTLPGNANDNVKVMTEGMWMTRLCHLAFSSVLRLLSGYLSPQKPCLIFCEITTIERSFGYDQLLPLQVIVDSAPNAKLSLGSIGVASRLITCTGVGEGNFAEHNVDRYFQPHNQRDPVAFHVIREILLQARPELRFPFQINCDNRRVLFALMECRDFSVAESGVHVRDGHPASVSVHDPDMFVGILCSDAQCKLGVEAGIGEDVERFDADALDPVVGDFGVVNVVKGEQDEDDDDDDEEKEATAAANAPTASRRE